ncbi:MAG: undecaprenyl/decaprenyl-phosphate alpha-N-acetylglucosaminyl 1-phosphate transferase [Gammaproteobacteria bacterium]|nr:undecaprenyl/decaprenyl-phosphate alpha-N-acetylglucosaminyl 1-phosphate transferase [Gammaproteobacteria bacterium]
MLFSAGLALGLIPLARTLDLLDHPGARKVHLSTTPMTGGPAIFISFGLFLLAYFPEDRFVQALLAGGGLLLITGLADDRQHLAPWVRFFVQIAACLLMIYWPGIYLSDFGSLFTSDVLGLGALNLVITIFAALGVINAFNMIDGMDGLAGGIFMVSGTGLAIYAGLNGLVQTHWMLVAVLFAVAGFLLLNARLPWNARARVFLGDSGSTFLGFLLAWAFIALGSDSNEIGQRAYMPMTAVWLFAVPLLDTATIIWHRWRSGSSAFRGDQHHLHHAFLRAGFSTGQAWFGIMLLAIVLAGAGSFFEAGSFPDYYSFWAFILVAFVYFRLMRRTWRIQRFMGRDFIYNDFDQEAGY